MVLMDGVDGDRVDDALSFRRIHSDNEETHQDVCVCFADTGPVISATGDNGGMVRVTSFAFALMPNKRLWSSTGGP